MNAFKNRLDEQRYNDKVPGEDRLVMLCDGVFAIAITLLVINIKIPPNLSENAFNQALINLLTSSVLFYLITFSTIASYWMQHRRLMHMMKSLDGRFFQLTFLFLAFIAFFPVTSAIIGEGYGYRSSVVLYTLSFAGCGFSLLLIWLYASWHHRFIKQDITREDIIKHSIAIAAVPTYFSLSLLLLLTPLNPPYVYFSWILIPLVGAITRRTPWHRLIRQSASGMPELQSTSLENQFQSVEGRNSNQSKVEETEKSESH